MTLAGHFLDVAGCCPFSTQRDDTIRSIRQKNSVIPSLSAPIYGGLLPKAATALRAHGRATKFLR
jgi:hypothetical protein